MAYQLGLFVNGPGSRDRDGQPLFIDDFRHPMPTYWNDGLGSATRDNDVTLCGLPSLRLDPQGQTYSSTTLATPTGLAVNAVGSGGSFAAGTYFWKVTARNFVGETVGSAEVSTAIVANGSAGLTWNAVAGATSYGVYRGTVTNTEFLVATVTGTSYTDTGTATGAAIPTSGSTNSPGRTAAITGVVAKRRILDPYVSRFGVEAWFRMTSQNVNNSTTSFPIIALYSRDGASAYHGRVWLNVMGNNTPMQAWILDGAATAAANPGQVTSPTAPAVWRSVATSTQQNGAGSHSYDPANGPLDRAGAWHHVKLVVDLVTKQYVSVQLDGGPVADVSAYSLDVTDSAGAAMVHFSFEFAATTSTRRFINIARVVGTME